MFKILFVLVLFALAKLVEKTSRKKAMERKTYLYKPVEYRDSSYGRLKEKIRLRAQDGHSNYAKIMEELDQAGGPSWEYEKMQEDMQERLEKLEAFQARLSRKRD